MKVLIYYDKNNLKPTGGPSGYLYNLKKELEKEKIDYIEFLDLKSSNLKKKIKSKISPKFIKLVKKILGKNEYNYINDILENKKRVSNIDLNEYDIIHFHSALSMYSIKDSLENYRGVVVYTSHSPKAAFKEINEDYIPKEEYMRNKDKYDSLFVLDEYCLNRADYIIFPVPEAEECYANSWDKYNEIKEKNKDKYYYIPTGLKKINSNVDINDYRNSLSIPQNAFVVSYVGRHNEVKGYCDLKENAKMILEKYKNVYFLIGGKEEPIKGLDNERWIEIGWTNRPYDLIKSSDIFVLPNKETYFDLILLEVLCLGKPVLLSRTGGNKYFEKYKTNGLKFYDYNNKKSFLEKFEEYYTLNNMECAEKENAKLFDDNFDISIFVKKYLHFLNEVNKNEKR